MKIKLKILFLFILFISCAHHDAFLPLKVKCVENESLNINLCYNFDEEIEYAIESHNAELGEDVLVYLGIDGVDNSALIEADFNISFENYLGSGVSGQTTIDSNNNGNIILDSRNFEMPCVIMHELGHALGYHGHYEEDGTLMSESADCETEGWYDDFYDWFQENYQ